MPLLRAARKVKFKATTEASVSLNWRKGFNRVFVLASIAWAGYVLVLYPANKQHEAYERYGREMRHCFDNDWWQGYLGQGYKTQDVTKLVTECTEQAESDWENARRNTFLWALGPQSASCKMGHAGLAVCRGDSSARCSLWAVSAWLAGLRLGDKGFSGNLTGL